MSVTMDTMSSASPSLRRLARREIGRYLRHPLYWAGAAALAVLTVLSIVNPTEPASTTLDMLGPAALLGLLGLFVMVSLTRGSDAAAEVAGAVATSERTRTLALASAVTVPVGTALVWYATAVYGYFANPPGPGTVPFGPLTDAWVLAVMFALGVVAAAGGPILGLVLARWLPRRGAAAIAAVLLVLATIVLQGNFASLQRWRLIWPWTYFYGPFGWNTGTEQWVALTGSPYLWILYLVSLCVLGVLVAVAHDGEHDRRPVLRAIAVTAVVAAVLVALSVVGGLDQPSPNPLPASAPAAGA